MPLKRASASQSPDVNAGYHIEPVLIKFLLAERGKDLSIMMNEAVLDLLTKYGSL